MDDHKSIYIKNAVWLAVLTLLEVEELVDRRDRIHSRLYTKLIISLCDPVAKPDNDLFRPAATLFRCSFCGLFLTKI